MKSKLKNIKKLNKVIFSKSSNFLLVLVLIYGFSFPRIDSFSQLINNPSLFLNQLTYAQNEPENIKIEPVKILTPEEQMVEIISEVARQENYENTDLLINIAKAESQLNPNVRGKVDKRDRGLYQINSYYNKDVTDECAFDPWCSTRWTINELEAGHAWKWNASRYKWARYY